MEEGRLLQLYAKSLLEGVVEDGFAGSVSKIGEHNGVLFCEHLCLARPQVKSAGDDRGKQQQPGNEDSPSTQGSWRHRSAARL